MTGRVVVIGSLNVDLVAAVSSHPRPGETVRASSLQRLPGGKGANQAVAAAAAGAAVSLVGCVGADADGAAYLAGLAARGVDTSAVRRVAGPTGTALVVVDEHGENSIVVVPGANGAVTLDDVHRLTVGSGDVVLVQLEIPLPVVAAAVVGATRSGTRVVLNLAPFADLSPALLEACDPVVANEHEASMLARRPGSLVVTSGEHGARWERGSRHDQVPAPQVDVVDTTGAGDAFCGALAAALAAGADDVTAMTRAVAAGAESVSRPGAQGGWTL